MKKNFLIYLPCIGKSRTFAPAFQERESRLKLTCCKCVLIALTNNQNNLLFLWSLILKFVIFAVRFAIKGVLFRCLSPFAKRVGEQTGKTF